MRRHFPRPTFPLFFVEPHHQPSLGKISLQLNLTKVWRKQAVDFAENIANEQCAMTPNALWAGDITYIPTDEGWLYLAVVIDIGFHD